MHIILGLIGLATAAYFLVIRARNGAEMATELLDVADDIRAAARRFGFRRQRDLHPVESIDVPRLAIGGLASAFIALDDLPTSDTRSVLDVQLRKHLHLNAAEAEEIEVLGQWFVSESGGPTSAVPRLSKKLHQLDANGASFADLMAILQGIAQAGPGLSQRQSDALDDIQRAFRLR